MFHQYLTLRLECTLIYLFFFLFIFFLFFLLGIFCLDLGPTEEKRHPLSKMAKPKRVVATDCSSDFREVLYSESRGM